MWVPSVHLIKEELIATQVSNSSKRARKQAGAVISGSPPNVPTEPTVRVGHFSGPRRGRSSRQCWIGPSPSPLFAQRAWPMFWIGRLRGPSWWVKFRRYSRPCSSATTSERSPRQAKATGSGGFTSSRDQSKTFTLGKRWARSDPVVSSVACDRGERRENSQAKPSGTSLYQQRWISPFSWACVIGLNSVFSFFFSPRTPSHRRRSDPRQITSNRCAHWRRIRPAFPPRRAVFVVLSLWMPMEITCVEFSRPCWVIVCWRAASLAIWRFRKTALTRKLERQCRTVEELRCQLGSVRTRRCFPGSSIRCITLSNRSARKCHTSDVFNSKVFFKTFNFYPVNLFSHNFSNFSISIVSDFNGSNFGPI